MIWNMNREDFLRNPESYHKIADDNVNVYKVGYVIENSFYDGSVFCPYIPHVTESYSIKHLKEKTGLYLDEDICQNNLYLRNGYLSYSEELIFKPDGKIINFYPKEKKNDGCIDRLFQERCLIRIYDKFVIVYACFLMFFIGAPLGAIIRKGGLGLPIVFAMLIFITFHFINTFGKRLAQENGMTPFLGAWLSSFILTPLAILLTYRATNDIGLINMDVILAPFQKIIKKIFPSQN